LIRAARPEDAEAVARLWTEAYVTSRQGGRAEPYSESDFAASSAAGEVFVAEGGGELLGVVVLYAPGAEGRHVGRPGEAELSRLAVFAGSRRNGIGTGLAGRCEERARAEGWEAIALWSRPWQAAAHRLYEKLGYERAPERDDVDAGGGARLVYVRSLG
jgi:ribosomal protein S18 acetylase RimI-like enzyme